MKNYNFWFKILFLSLFQCVAANECSDSLITAILGILDYYFIGVLATIFYGVCFSWWDTSNLSSMTGLWVNINCMCHGCCCTFGCGWQIIVSVVEAILLEVWWIVGCLHPQINLYMCVCCGPRWGKFGESRPFTCLGGDPCPVWRWFCCKCTGLFCCMAEDLNWTYDKQTRTWNKKKLEEKNDFEEKVESESKDESKSKNESELKDESKDETDSNLLKIAPINQTIAKDTDKEKIMKKKTKEKENVLSSLESITKEDKHESYSDPNAVINPPDPNAAIRAANTTNDTDYRYPIAFMIIMAAVVYIYTRFYQPRTPSDTLSENSNVSNHASSTNTSRSSSTNESVQVKRVSLHSDQALLFDQEFHELCQLVDEDNTGRIPRDVFENLFPDKTESWPAITEDFLEVNKLVPLLYNCGNRYYDIDHVCQDIKKIKSILNIHEKNVSGSGSIVTPTTSSNDDSPAAETTSSVPSATIISTTAPEVTSATISTTFPENTSSISRAMITTSESTLLPTSSHEEVPAIIVATAEPNNTSITTLRSVSKEVAKDSYSSMEEDN